MTEPHWLTRAQVEIIHDDLMIEHGGLPGVRNETALEATLARPINLFLHQKADIFDLAAAYAHGIVNNHPFYDGNKRTAFVVADVFLKSNGYAFSMSEPEAVRLMVGLASTEITQQEFAEHIRRNSKRVAAGRTWIKRRNP